MLSVTVGLAGPAAADPPTVPGCGGAGSALVPASIPRVVSGTGDSFSSGEGTGGYRGASDSSSHWRHQSPYAMGPLAWLYLETTNKPLVPSLTMQDGYIEDTWGFGDRFEFLASSGAESKHLVVPQVDSDTGHNRNIPQADGILSNSNVVIYGFGGNDAHYGDILQTALMSYAQRAIPAYLSGLGVAPAWRSYQVADVNAAIYREKSRLTEVQTSVYKSLSSVRAAALNAMIAVTLYPVGVKPTGNPQINMMAGPTLDAIHGFATALNDTLRAAVQKFNSDHPQWPPIEVFDPNTAGPGGTSVVAGHEVGQPDSYFNPWMLDESQLLQGNLLHAFQESFHPNRKGTVALGQALAIWLQAKCPGLWPKPPTFAQVIIPAQPYKAPLGAKELPALLLQNMGAVASNSRGIPGAVVSGGGGGPVPRGDVYAEPDSPLYHLWLAMWAAASSTTGSSDPTSTGPGDASTPGGNTPEVCCGRYHWDHDNGDGTITRTEWGGDLSGTRYTLIIKSRAGTTTTDSPAPSGVLTPPRPGGVTPGGFDNPGGIGPGDIFDYYVPPPAPSGSSGGGGNRDSACDDIYVPCPPRSTFANLA
ncbi:hypothetical protein [Microtetraspora fusca]|uniref:SGNH hydrolase-type esterase domain-containing protein n=1 Tax=Microtetraspora fusca TaxID=1997 RepID=A0ABW6VEQ9_MICFU|nr:hypothetical protein [Microtetraspora fusca]